MAQLKLDLQAVVSLQPDLHDFFLEILSSQTSNKQHTATFGTISPVPGSLFVNPHDHNQVFELMGLDTNQSDPDNILWRVRRWSLIIHSTLADCSIQMNSTQYAASANVGTLQQLNLNDMVDNGIYCSAGYFGAPTVNKHNVVRTGIILNQRTYHQLRARPPVSSIQPMQYAIPPEFQACWDNASSRTLTTQDIYTDASVSQLAPSIYLTNPDQASQVSIAVTFASSPSEAHLARSYTTLRATGTLANISSYSAETIAAGVAAQLITNARNNLGGSIYTDSQSLVNKVRKIKHASEWRSMQTLECGHLYGLSRNASSQGMFLKKLMFHASDIDLHWVRGHPERLRLSPADWTNAQLGNYVADRTTLGRYADIRRYTRLPSTQIHEIPLPQLLSCTPPSPLLLFAAEGTPYSGSPGDTARRHLAYQRHDYIATRHLRRHQGYEHFASLTWDLSNKFIDKLPHTLKIFALKVQLDKLPHGAFKAKATNTGNLLPKPDCPHLCCSELAGPLRHDTQDHLFYHCREPSIAAVREALVDELTQVINKPRLYSPTEKLIILHLLRTSFPQQPTGSDARLFVALASPNLIQTLQQLPRLALSEHSDCLIKFAHFALPFAQHMWLTYCRLNHTIHNSVPSLPRQAHRGTASILNYIPGLSSQETANLRGLRQLHTRHTTLANNQLTLTQSTLTSWANANIISSTINPRPNLCIPLRGTQQTLHLWLHTSTATPILPEPNLHTTEHLVPSTI
jgi:hypothetical protein